MTRDDFEEGPLREVAHQERGTWREELRLSYAPWFDDLDLGFQCGDGWREIVTQLTGAIAVIVGGPDAAPGIRVVQVKEKLGTLRYYAWYVPEPYADAVWQAIQGAENDSARICETCGQTGRLRESRDGYWHTACDVHAVP